MLSMNFYILLKKNIIKDQIKKFRFGVLMELSLIIF